MHPLSRASYKILCIMTQTMGHPALLSISLTEQIIFGWTAFKGRKKSEVPTSSLRRTE